jgi:ADP-L-glycero-D-manno-heptose 6-epimerase
MIVITGAAGFIGSNLVKELNRQGIDDIILVDDLIESKVKNISTLRYSRLLSINYFFNTFDQWSDVTIIFHEGAISSTTEQNLALIQSRNQTPTRYLIEKSLQYGFLLSYASSASVYGDSTTFTETDTLSPQSLYAKSKADIDQFVNTISGNIQGWRYFNVYGHNEEHKLDQASPVSKFIQQAVDRREILLFEGSENYLRDFISVDDVVKIKIKAALMNVTGIYNLGTGVERSFRHIAECVADKFDCKITEIPLPDRLVGQYQKYTKANTDKLKTLIDDYNFISPSAYIREL